MMEVRVHTARGLVLLPLASPYQPRVEVSVGNEKRYTPLVYVNPQHPASSDLTFEQAFFFPVAYPVQNPYLVLNIRVIDFDSATQAPASLGAICFALADIKSPVTNVYPLQLSQGGSLQLSLVPHFNPSQPISVPEGPHPLSAANNAPFTPPIAPRYQPQTPNPNPSPNPGPAHGVAPGSVNHSQSAPHPHLPFHSNANNNPQPPVSHHGAHYAPQPNPPSDPANPNPNPNPSPNPNPNSNPNPNPNPSPPPAVKPSGFAGWGSPSPSPAFAPAPAPSPAPVIPPSPNFNHKPQVPAPFQPPPPSSSPNFFHPPPSPAPAQPPSNLPPAKMIATQFARQDVDPEKIPLALVAYNPSQVKRNIPPISSGAFGVVYTGTVFDRSEKIVIKDQKVTSPDSLKLWQREVGLMSIHRHPHIAQVYGFAFDNQTLTMVMEYLPKGSLFDLLHKRKEKLSVIQRLRMCRHVALAVAYLHKNNIIHRDVKSMNVLVTDDYSAKLTDFGTSKLLTNDSMKQKEDTQSRIAGTPRWMAPEVANYSFTYGVPADVYSLGIVLYEILQQALPPYVPSKRAHVFPDNFDYSFLVLPCVAFDADKRVTSQKVVKSLDEYLKRLLVAVAKEMDTKDESAVIALSDSARFRRTQENSKRGTNLSEDEEEEEGVGDLLQGIYSLLLSKPSDVVDGFLKAALEAAGKK